MEVGIKLPKTFHMAPQFCLSHLGCMFSCPAPTPVNSIASAHKQRKHECHVFAQFFFGDTIIRSYQDIASSNVYTHRDKDAHGRS